MEPWEWHGVVKALYQQPDKICFEKIWTDISISIYDGFMFVIRISVCKSPYVW